MEDTTTTHNHNFLDYVPLGNYLLCVGTRVGHGKSPGTSMSNLKILIGKGTSIDALPTGSIAVGKVYCHARPTKQTTKQDNPMRKDKGWNNDCNDRNERNENVPPP